MCRRAYKSSPLETQQQIKQNHQQLIGNGGKMWPQNKQNQPINRKHYWQGPFTTFHKHAETSHSISSITNIPYLTKQRNLFTSIIQSVHAHDKHTWTESAITQQHVEQLCLPCTQSLCESMHCQGGTQHISEHNK